MPTASLIFGKLNDKGLRVVVGISHHGTNRVAGRFAFGKVDRKFTEGRDHNDTVANRGNFCKRAKDRLPVTVLVAGDPENAPAHDLLGKRMPEHEITACLDGDEGRAFFSTQEYQLARKQKSSEEKKAAARFISKLRNPSKVIDPTGNDVETKDCPVGKPSSDLASLYHELERCEKSELKYKYFVGLDRFSGLSSGMRRKLQTTVSTEDREKLDEILSRLGSNSNEDLEFQEEVLKYLFDDLHDNYGASWNRIRTVLQSQDEGTNFADIRQKILGF